MLSSNVLIGSGSGRRRRRNFARAGGRRGAHGVTRPTNDGLATGLFDFIAHFGFRVQALCRREMMRELGSKPRHKVPAPQANGVAARLGPPWVVVLRPVAPGSSQNRGFPAGGVHARRRAWARLTRRQPPHARARALPETGSAWPSPDSTANGEESGKFEKCRDRQRVGKATSGEICSCWWQARRARSDAPYHAGRAAGLFDFMACFGVRVQALCRREMMRELGSKPRHKLPAPQANGVAARLRPPPSTTGGSRGRRLWI